MFIRKVRQIMLQLSVRLIGRKKESGKSVSERKFITPLVLANPLMQAHFPPESSALRGLFIYQ
ncbi:TPA: hypothetical protein I7147_15330 [Vibrio vulnificus]|nr:hypothetical protein [Vibrio vulnificus]HAS6224980.1 hypothetical protein [Vibrio vulnificus]